MEKRRLSLTNQDIQTKSFRLDGKVAAYGLAGSGEAGVAQALEILRADVERTLRLLGCASIAALDRSYVSVPPTWGAS
jgi:L-lactate dehydrogenase (cytochrome)